MPHSIPARPSSYYPPRAGGLRIPRRMISSMRAAIHLERIQLPRIQGLLRVMASVAIPGLAFHLTGPRLTARIIWAALPLLFLVFLVGLGTFISEAAFAVIIGTHVASVSHLMRPLMIRNRLALQMVFGVVLFLAASVFLYIPAREWFHLHVALPVTIRGQVVVINPRADATTVHRGDVVAYRFDSWARQNIRVREGLGLEPVLAMPGDRLVFGDGIMYVNGSLQRLPLSARAWGSLVVPEHCWFIWPQLDSFNRGTVRGVEDTLRGLALVDQGQLAGRPYRWWFFRAQGST